MNLFKESLRSLGLDEFLPLPFCLCVMGERGARVENVLKISEIDPLKISLDVKNGTVSLTGEDLYVISYDSGDVTIGGKVKGVVIAE